MTLVVRTARVGPTRYADELNVTRATGEGDGLAFAPSWAILGPALRARREAAEIAAAFARNGGGSRGGCADAERIEGEAWAAYVPAYLAEMRRSYRERRRAWVALLARESVTLLCFCVDPARCHRTLLAREILPKLGAAYAGERATATAEALALPGVGR